MKKINILLFASLLFTICGCDTGKSVPTSSDDTPTSNEEEIHSYSSFISFNLFYKESQNKYQYFFVDSNNATLDYLKSETLPDVGPFFPGDYINISFTSYYNGIYCEPVYPPKCYIYDGELLSKEKIEHKTETVKYSIIDGVGTFITDGRNYTYNKNEYYLNLSDGCAYPFSDLQDGDILNVSYSELESTYDNEGILTHKISCFYI